ncbi:radical SAM family heme chaperone HemW [Microbacterium imperiale]|uniref:Heme chaperone HemW n=1 Tax=Microbacterium imperiale TaxID=33884 RepID=A0A9W6HFQ4_9MICO|nr:radical SAM family heme chaperone HemW [Microbacterium imperiale]MBP2419443.1 oxygen-independent coproporphyrinogen-3 oxidase [Microbacterium imperiale]MDS0198687.1 radical SAM family heme chaperone HemW [Microbacterium imperiale]BFE39785.1 radical SAM family heme chaperone HemW [Microbacterium imperiale]GLJ79240.1 coproporphyrinogen III oxidase [Microbacterium imperiale]
MGAALPLGDPVPADGALPDDLLVSPDADFGVYLHVPFCRVRCGYCDFNTYTATELRGARQDAYADEVLREVALSARVLDARGPRRPAATVFFGGGTPTLLPPGDLARMLGGVRDTFGIAPGAEVTVEANPDTMTPAVADELAAAGVTRLSIGMQSAVPHVLAALDRTHDPANVATAVSAARSAGLDVSLDLIYGAPGESLADWRASVETAIALAPDHVSAYALIIEDGTKLERQIRRGEVPAPDDDLQADMYETADTLLAAAGYSWYEVSNWATSPEQRSRHNLAYWRGTDWWGYGPGAHSHVGGLRWWNVKHPAAYAQRLAMDASPAAGRERPDAAARRLESVLLRTRIAEGLPVAELDEDGRRGVAALIADGLIEGADAVRGRIVLTRRGRLMADAVVRALTE